MKIKDWFVKNASGLLSLTACIGVVFTAVLSANAAIKAQGTIKEWTEEKHDDLTMFEKVQASAKHVVLPIASAAGTIYCISKSHRIDKEHVATLAGVAVMAGKRYDDYRKANVKVNGKEAHERVLQELAAQKAKPTDLQAASLMSYCSTGAWWDSGEERLFYDSITEQYFTSTLARVMDAQYHLNRNFTMGCDYVNVQMWCDFLGIENKNDDQRGWALNDDYTWLDFDNHKPVDIGDGLEACIIECAFDPEENYWDQ